MIDALADRGLHLGQDYDLSGRDHGAIKASTADPALIAEVFDAVRASRWGDEYLRTNLSLHLVIDRINAYRVWRAESEEPYDPEYEAKLAEANRTGREVTYYRRIPHDGARDGYRLSLVSVAPG